MNDQGFGSLSGSTDMNPKALTLPGHIKHTAPVQAEVIQPGFTNTDHLGQCRTAQKIVQQGFAHPFVVRVNAGGAPKIIVSQGQRMNLVKLFERGADHHGTINAGVLHGHTDLRQIAFELRKIKMAMRICEHQKNQKRFWPSPSGY